MDDEWASLAQWERDLLRQQLADEDFARALGEEDSTWFTSRGWVG